MASFRIAQYTIREGKNNFDEISENKTKPNGKSLSNQLITIEIFILRSATDSDDNNNSNNHQTAYNLLCGPMSSGGHFEQCHFDGMNQTANFNVNDTNNGLLTMQMHSQNTVHSHSHSHSHTHPHYHAQHNGNHMYYNWQVCETKINKQMYVNIADVTLLVRN